MAFGAAHRAARNPRDIERCSPESIASAVALSALTGLMPGGAMPSVWLVPRAGELQWMISHRGLTQLCRRAGYQLSTCVVGHHDHIVVEFGEVTEHRAKIGSEPLTLDHIAGVIVSCRRLADGAVLGRYWLPGADIRKRRNAKDYKGRPMASKTWDKWPMEMAQKTAIKWACARGLVPIESVELDNALAADTRAEMTPKPPPVEVPRVAMPLPSDVFAPPPEPETVEAEIIDDPAALGGDS
jgi:recombinational DNA repair protein RecT